MTNLRKCEECGIEVPLLQSRFDKAEAEVIPMKVCVRRLCVVCCDVWDAVTTPYFLRAQVEYLSKNMILAALKQNILNPPSERR